MMSFEKPGSMPDAIPEHNELPLAITSSEANARQGRESALWKVAAKDKQGNEQPLVLKQVREALADDRELAESKKFYDFLKSSPQFSRFVPNTFFIKARADETGEPHAFRIQPFIEGKRMDEVSDEELYRDPALMRELIEFIDGAIQIIEKAKQEKRATPDLYGDTFASSFLFNPRESSNIVITEAPDGTKHLRLVDVNPQVNLKKGLGKSYQHYIGSTLQTLQLKRWKKVLESKLHENRGS